VYADRFSVSASKPVIATWEEAGSLSIKYAAMSAMAWSNVTPLSEAGAFRAVVALLEAGLLSTELVAQVEKTRPLRHKVTRNTIFFIKSPFILKRGKRKNPLPGVGR
jgi:hypothetical protein